MANPTRTSGESSTIHLAPVLPPGRTGLATILGPADWLPSGQQLSDAVAREYARLQSHDAITISLDAVLFEDGTTLGGDKLATIPDMRARIRSEYDLYHSVVAKADAGVAGPEILSGLQAAESAAPTGVSQRTLGPDAYTRRYRFYTARLAEGLIRTANRSSSAAMITGVRQILQTKTYPKEMIQ